MPGSCPFWLADTAGWKNSAGICRRGLEASGEKGLDAAGKEEEVLGTAQEAGIEHQLSREQLNNGCEKTLGKSPTQSLGFTLSMSVKKCLDWVEVTRPTLTVGGAIPQAGVLG